MSFLVTVPHTIMEIGGHQPVSMETDPTPGGGTVPSPLGGGLASATEKTETAAATTTTTAAAAAPTTASSPSPDGLPPHGTSNPPLASSTPSPPGGGAAPLQTQHHPPKESYLNFRKLEVRVISQAILHSLFLRIDEFLPPALTFRYIHTASCPSQVFGTSWTYCQAGCFTR